FRTGYPASFIVQGAYIMWTPGNVFSIDSGFSSSVLFLNSPANVVSGRLRILNGGQNAASSAYYNLPVYIANFTTNFDFQLTNPKANGITFVLQNQGKTALGTRGGGLGYGPKTPGGTPAGISPSAAIKFDLYNSAGEGSDSTGLYTDGASPTIPAINLTNTGIDLHSGHIFAVTL